VLPTSQLDFYVFTASVITSHVPVNEPLLEGNESKNLTECVDTDWISSEGPFVKKSEEGLVQLGYTSSIIPEQWRLLYSLNPIVNVIDGFRWCISWWRKQALFARLLAK
jgi:hypothetical protein